MYIDKDALKEVIKNQRDEINNLSSASSNDSETRQPFKQGWMNALRWFEEKLDELEEENISEDLDKEASAYIDKTYNECGYQDEFGNPHIPYYKIGKAFIDGANWRYSVQKAKKVPFISNEFNEEFDSYVKQVLGESLDDEMHVGLFELIKLAEHFSEWQKEQDAEARKLVMVGTDKELEDAATEYELKLEPIADEKTGSQFAVYSYRDGFRDGLSYTEQAFIDGGEWQKEKLFNRMIGPFKDRPAAQLYFAEWAGLHAIPYSDTYYRAFEQGVNYGKWYKENEKEDTTDGQGQDSCGN